MGLFDFFRRRQAADQPGGAVTLPDRLRAGRLALPTGSWQNPAWSPDGVSLSLTRFDRYNEGNSSVWSYDLRSGALRRLLQEAVSQPGACWRSGGLIVSSTRGGNDAIYRIVNNSDAQLLLALPGKSLYEPTWSPMCDAFAFESHDEDVEGNGRIGIASVKDPRGTLRWLTGDHDDCRQPCWSSDGALLVYQRQIRSRWSLWVQSPNGGVSASRLQINGDATDATWTPDGRILCSAEDGLLLVHPREPARPIGPRGGYRGAPSMSADRRWIACEAFHRDPDGGPGTWIELLQVPDELS